MITPDGAIQQSPVSELALEASDDMIFKFVSSETSSAAASRKATLSLADKVASAFPRDPRMIRIAAVESTGTIGRFDETAQNPSSTASGLFQITDPTWRDFSCAGDKLKADDSIACAVKIHAKRGVAPWESSHAMWKE